MKHRWIQALIVVLPLFALAGCGDGEVHMSEAEMKQNIADRHKTDAANSLPPGIPDSAKENIRNTPVGGR